MKEKFLKIKSTLRHLLTSGGGGLAAVSDFGTFASIASFLAVAAGFVWSFFDKTDTPPDKSKLKEQGLGIARHILTTFGGILIVKGIFTLNFIKIGIGALLLAGGLFWSWWDKNKRKQAAG